MLVKFITDITRDCLVKGSLRTYSIEGDSFGPNLIKLLGAYLGAYLSQINGVRGLYKRLKVL